MAPRTHDAAALAALALLDPEPEALAQLDADLVAILAFVAQLEAVTVDGVEPTTHPLAPPTPWREDEPAPGLTAQAALANAPERTADGCFAVPEILVPSVPEGLEPSAPEGLGPPAPEAREP